VQYIEVKDRFIYRGLDTAFQGVPLDHPSSCDHSAGSMTVKEIADGSSATRGHGALVRTLFDMVMRSAKD